MPSCCLFRRSTYELAGGWDEETGRMVYEDKDLVMRCSLIAPVHMLNEYLVRYRWHESNASHNDNPGFREHFEGRWLHGTFMTPRRNAKRRGVASRLTGTWQVLWHSKAQSRHCESAISVRH